MATRSTISVILPDGKVQSIYAHWDGYPSHNGRILKESYNSLDKALALVDMGSVAVLGETIGTKTDFDNPSKGQCIFYDRDRGEELKVSTYTNFEMFRLTGDFQEYNYVFDNGWKLLTDKGLVEYSCEED